MVVVVARLIDNFYYYVWIWYNFYMGLQQNKVTFANLLAKVRETHQPVATAHHGGLLSNKNITKIHRLPTIMGTVSQLWRIEQLLLEQT